MTEHDPVAEWLEVAARPTPPPGLLARIDDVVAAAPAARRAVSDRPARPVALVGLALAAAFLVQGVGNVVTGEWIAEGLGEPHAPHAYFEGALAMVAAAVCAAAAAVRRAWAGLSVLTCTPLAVSLGIGGVGEIGRFAAGVVLHLTEGVLGLALVLAWWWSRRDSARRRREGEA